MAAVEADVLRARLDGEGANAGVMVSSSSGGAMRPMDTAAAPAAPAGPLMNLIAKSTPSVISLKTAGALREQRRPPPSSDTGGPLLLPA